MLTLNITMAAVSFLRRITKMIHNAHILKTTAEVASFKIMLHQIHQEVVIQDQVPEADEEINPLDLNISVKHLFF